MLLRSNFFVGQPMMIGWTAVEPPPSAPVITSSLTRNATVGRSFSYTITAKGRPAPTFTVTGLPAGLTFSGRAISGVPTTAATTNITLTATNSEGSDTKTLVLTVAAGGGGPGPTPGSGIPWTVTYDFYSTTNFAAGTQIPLTNFVGWQAAYDADMTNALYDTPTQAAMKVRLFSTRAPAAEAEVPFDNWGPHPLVGNTIHEWGYISSTHSIRVGGTNSNTGVPFQLRLEHTP